MLPEYVGEDETGTVRPSAVIVFSCQTLIGGQWLPTVPLPGVVVGDSLSKTRVAWMT